MSNIGVLVFIGSKSTNDIFLVVLNSQQSILSESNPSQVYETHFIMFHILVTPFVSSNLSVGVVISKAVNLLYKMNWRIMCKEIKIKTVHFFLLHEDRRSAHVENVWITENLLKIKKKNK